MEPSSVAIPDPAIVAAPVTGAAAPAANLLFVPASIGVAPTPTVELETKAKNDALEQASVVVAPEAAKTESLPNLDPLTVSRQGLFNLIRDLGGDESKQQMAADLIRSLLAHGAAVTPGTVDTPAAPNARVERRLTMLPEHDKPAFTPPVFDVKGTDYFSS